MSLLALIGVVVQVRRESGSMIQQERVLPRQRSSRPGSYPRGRGGNEASEVRSTDLFGVPDVPKYEPTGVRTSDHVGLHLISKYELQKVRTSDLPGEPNISLPRTGGSLVNSGPPAGFTHIS